MTADTEININYYKRLAIVKRNRKFWSFGDVRQRLLAKGKEKGSSEEHIRTVLIKNPKIQNEEILEAAEEVIKIRQQILLPDPIALSSKEEIIAEYEAARAKIGAL